MKEYQVQRKFVGWEEQTVMAESYEDAIEQARQQGNWKEDPETCEATEDHWVNNIDTMQAKVSLQEHNYQWRDAN